MKCHYCETRRPRRAAWFYTISYPDRIAVYCDSLQLSLKAAIPIHPIVATCPACALKETRKFITFQGVRV